MKIDLFSIGKFTIHGYGLMIAIGILCCVAMASYRAKKNGLDQEAIVDIGIYGVIGGFLGAKILYVIVEFKTFTKDPKTVLGSEGFVVYGGIIAGFLTAIVYCRIKKLYFLEYFDLAVASISMAQGFGRIGCFLAGCCYGRPTDSVFGVVFPEDSLAPAGIKLIPTQLISAAGDFAIAIILIILADVVFKKAKESSLKAKTGFGMVSGDIGCIYMFLYGIGRFLVEFLRNDVRGTVGNLSTSQFISLFIVAGSIILYVINHKKASA